jgi:hypothetical protein
MEQDTTVHHVTKLSRGLSPAAQQRLQRFKIEYKQSVRISLEAVALAVMIWGPAVDAGSPLAQKRWALREALEARGHLPLFGEEVEGEVDLKDLISDGKGLLFKALHQARTVDFLILLLDEERAMGVVSELHLCTRKDIAAKVFVIIPKSLEQSFLRGVIKMIEGGNGAIYWYTPFDLEESYVLTSAIDRIEDRRMQYAYENAGVVV